MLDSSSEKKRRKTPFSNLTSKSGISTEEIDNDIQNLNKLLEDFEGLPHQEVHDHTVKLANKLADKISAKAKREKLDSTEMQDVKQMFENFVRLIAIEKQSRENSAAGSAISSASHKIAEALPSLKSSFNTHEENSDFNDIVKNFIFANLAADIQDFLKADNTQQSEQTESLIRKIANILPKAGEYTGNLQPLYENIEYKDMMKFIETFQYRNNTINQLFEDYMIYQQNTEMAQFESQRSDEATEEKNNENFEKLVAEFNQMSHPLPPAPNFSDFYDNRKSNPSEWEKFKKLAENEFARGSLSFLKAHEQYLNDPTVENKNKVQEKLSYIIKENNADISLDLKLTNNSDDAYLLESSNKIKNLLNNKLFDIFNKINFLFDDSGQINPKRLNEILSNLNSNKARLNFIDTVYNTRLSPARENRLKPLTEIQITNIKTLQNSFSTTLNSAIKNKDPEINQNLLHFKETPLMKALKFEKEKILPKKEESFDEVGFEKFKKDNPYLAARFPDTSAVSPSLIKDTNKEEKNATTEPTTAKNLTSEKEREYLEKVFKAFKESNTTHTSESINAIATLKEKYLESLFKDLMKGKDVDLEAARKSDLVNYHNSKFPQLPGSKTGTREAIEFMIDHGPDIKDHVQDMIEGYHPGALEAFPTRIDKLIHKYVAEKSAEKTTQQPTAAPRPGDSPQTKQSNLPAAEPPPYHHNGPH